jgi:hypothetical protein
VQVVAQGMGKFHSGSLREWAFLSGTEEHPAAITLQHAGRIVGRVITKLPGVSLAGLTVGLQGTKGLGVTSSPNKITTDAKGQFEIADLMPGTSNVFLLDHEPDGAWTYAAAEGVITKPGEVTVVNIELIEGRIVEGVVVDPNGKPIADANVIGYGPIRPRSGAVSISYRTKADGKYRYRLPSGGAHFYASGDGYIAQGGALVHVPEGKGAFTAPTLTLVPTREVVLKLLKQNGGPANDVEIIAIGNDERHIDLTERPLIPELDGSVLLLRDNPIGFVTEGRLELTVRRKDGREFSIKRQLPKATEIEVIVP